MREFFQLDTLNTEMDERIKIIFSDKNIRVMLMDINSITDEDIELLRLNFPRRYERAQHFKFEADRLRCLAAGYLMYEVLGVDETQLRIGEFGKPYIREPGKRVLGNPYIRKDCSENGSSGKSEIERGDPNTGGSKIDFNLSHSGDYAVLAVLNKAGYPKTTAEESECSESIGVDIEKIDNRNISVADRVFCEDELAWMSGNPEERFWPLWTLKEAASKALGTGMSIDYRSFSVLPLIRGDSIELEGRILYGRTEPVDGHSLAVVTGNHTPSWSKEML